MAGKPKFSEPAAGPDNQFVRDALELSKMTQPALAKALEDLDLGFGNYTKSKIGKMARTQKVRAAEVVAISRVTGVPIPTDLAALAMREEISEIAMMLEDWPQDSLMVVRPVLGMLRTVPAERIRDVLVMLSAFLGRLEPELPHELQPSDTAEDRIEAE